MESFLSGKEKPGLETQTTKNKGLLAELQRPTIQNINQDELEETTFF